MRAFFRIASVIGTGTVTMLAKYSG